MTLIMAIHVDDVDLLMARHRGGRHSSKAQGIWDLSMEVANLMIESQLSLECG